MKLEELKAALETALLPQERDNLFQNCKNSLLTHIEFQQPCNGQPLFLTVLALFPDKKMELYEAFIQNAFSKLKEDLESCKRKPSPEQYELTTNETTNLELTLNEVIERYPDDQDIVFNLCMMNLSSQPFFSSIINKLTQLFANKVEQLYQLIITDLHRFTQYSFPILQTIVNLFPNHKEDFFSAIINELNQYTNFKFSILKSLHSLFKDHTEDLFNQAKDHINKYTNYSIPLLNELLRLFPTHNQDIMDACISELDKYTAQRIDLLSNIAKSQPAYKETIFQAIINSLPQYTRFTLANLKSLVEIFDEHKQELWQATQKQIKQYASTAKQQEEYNSLFSEFIAEDESEVAENLNVHEEANNSKFDRRDSGSSSTSILVDQNNPLIDMHYRFVNLQLGEGNDIKQFADFKAIVQAFLNSAISQKFVEALKSLQQHELPISYKLGFIQKSYKYFHYRDSLMNCNKNDGLKQMYEGYLTFLQTEHDEMNFIQKSRHNAIITKLEIQVRRQPQVAVKPKYPGSKN